MNIPSDHLFHLIKSLGKNEKKYFKNFASMHHNGEEKIPVRLFDAINRQKVYDESKIICKFPDMFSPSRLPNEKNYLHQLILKSMRNYHAGSNPSINMQLNNILINVEILYEKTLYEQCIKLLKKARKLATTYGEHILLLEIIKWEKLMYFSGKTAEYLQNITNDEGDILKIINNKHKYHKLLSKFFELTKNEEIIRTHKDVELIKEIFKSPLLRSYQKTQSLEAKLLYYNLYSVYFHVSGIYNYGYYFCEKWVGLLESHPGLINENPINYINALDYFLFSLDKHKNPEKFFSNLKKLKEIPAKFPKARNKRIEIAIILRYYNHLIALYNQTGNFEKSIAFIPEIKKLFTLFHGKMNKYHELMLHLRIANAYFALKDYINAMYWLKPIMADKPKEVRQNLHNFAMLLNLIIHYELSFDNVKPYDELRKHIRTIYRFFLKKQRLYNLEYVILNFFRKQILNIKTHKEQIEAFKVLRKDLIEILKDPFERKALEYFDFISWLESKIEGRPMKEIIKRKLGVKGTAVRSLEPIN